ncbi:hypothetical protein GH714_014694 [Hevea brasiliensis]|uniref:CCHC-type domain-containing protein n=1 Tax=Hevea brasiliensis TaxID=3981 RepID=A0A6A6L1T6_HEVBR|nr:hypothetical protein GH714_014694 [Hevea brasiliensis]
MDTPTFNRDLDIKGFLDWLTKVDHFVEYATILEEQKVKLVASQLKGGASKLSLKAEIVIKQEPFGRYGDNKFAIEKEKGKTTQRASNLCGTNTKKSSNKAPTIGGSKGTNSNAPKTSNPYAKPAAIKCHRCNEVGHHSNEYPKRKSINIVEREPEDEEEEFCGPDGDDVEEEYEQEEGVYVVRKLMLSPKVKDNT